MSIFELPCIVTSMVSRVGLIKRIKHKDKSTFGEKENRNVHLLRLSTQTWDMLQMVCGILIISPTLLPEF